MDRRYARCYWVALLGVVAISVVGWGCMPKLYIKDSFRQALALPVVQGTIALDRGETIELSEIMKKEKVTPQKVVLTKHFGAYLVTAEGFRQIWRIRPADKDAATYEAIDAPNKQPLKDPQFAHSESHNCVTLTLNNGQERWEIHASGSIARSCSDAAK